MQGRDKEASEGEDVEAVLWGFISDNSHNTCWSCVCLEETALRKLTCPDPSPTSGFQGDGHRSRRYTESSPPPTLPKKNTFKKSFKLIRRTGFFSNSAQWGVNWEESGKRSSSEAHRAAGGNKPGLIREFAVCRCFHRGCSSFLSDSGGRGLFFPPPADRCH